jgi:putative copper export protein
VEAAPRWLAYLAMLLVIGASVFRFGVLAPLRRRNSELPPELPRRTATIGVIAATALMLVHGLRLYTQVQSFTEPGEPVTLELFGIVLDSTWGRGWLAQVLAAGLAAAGAFFARVAPVGWISAAAGATAVVLAAPLTGHATAVEEAGAWGYPLDALHVLGAGAWIGTLGVLLIAGLLPGRGDLGESRGGTIALLTNAFHPIALVGAGLTILAGLMLSWLYLQGHLTVIWTSGWGRSLLLKLLLLVGVAGFGAWNWRVMRPTLGSAEAARRLTRSALSELAIATALLLVTAVLVARALPGEEEHEHEARMDCRRSDAGCSRTAAGPACGSRICGLDAGPGG